MFSEIAHSSKTEPFALLAVNLDDDTITYSVLPQYNSTNTIVALNNHIQIFFDFSIYLFSFQGEFIPSYTNEDDMQLMTEFIEKVNLQNFQYLTDLHNKKEVNRIPTIKTYLHGLG